MARSKTPTFVYELPLVVSAQADRTLCSRFEAARQLYNAVLGEALRRLNLVKQSKAWQMAREMPRGEKDSPEQKARAAAFNKACDAFHFTEHALQSYATECKNACWIGDHLDAHVTQTIATRAAKAVKRYQFCTAGRPRFKSKWKAIESVEGKSNAAGIRWRGDHLEWKRLTLHPLFDRKDKHGVETFALQCRVKYVRLVWRWLRGKRRWYVQLALEGRPKWKDKHPVGQDLVGLDIGPSTIAAVGNQKALLEKFCPSVEYQGREIRRIQRAMDRSRRAMNPDNYDPDGTVKKGPKQWVYSQRYLKHQARLRELQRRMAAARKTEHGELANRVIAMGPDIQTEKLSYRAFQKRYGRSIRDRAPGRFLDQLRRKAESAGGALVEFPTRTTCLSQVCHCGAKKKKPLSQRVHDCGCGVVIQRDLYSAFLARSVEGETLHAGLAQSRWPGAEPLLRAAWQRATCDRRDKVPVTFGTVIRRRSGSSEEKGIAETKSRDVVAEAPVSRESPEKATAVPLRTPCL